MNVLKAIFMMILGAGAASALVFLTILMPRTGPPKLSQHELNHLTKIFFQVRNSPQPPAAFKQGKMLVLESGGLQTPYSGSSNETLTLLSPALPPELLATSLPEAYTLVFLDREPVGENSWRYHAYLATPEGRALGQFLCDSSEVREKLASLQEAKR
ncbi:hypothetical protein JST97_37045 [bacterium]|nr:hypothetical protein [bacterium]